MADDDSGRIPEIEAPNPFVLMPNILDKLKILNYEHDFAKDMMNGELLHLAYFSVPHPKPNEQFYYFTSLFSWLMKKNRFNFPRPDQFDDPNATVTEIEDALRKARLQIDYPAAKLKQGYGEAICQILDLLCDGALEISNFKLKEPVYPPDTYPEEAPVDEDEEVDEADTVGIVQADDDDVYQPRGKQGGGKGDNVEDSTKNKIMESTTDPKAWMVEVENVAPMLKMRAEADNKEWRTHLEKTKELQENISNKFASPGPKLGSTKETLDKLSSGIKGAMDHIATREQSLNTKYKEKVTEYHAVQERLTEVMKRYDEGNSSLSAQTNRLTMFTDELEAIRSQMDERGNSMTDRAPLEKLKDAMKKIKKDITGMDLRIGIVSHSLVNFKLSQHQREESRGFDRDEEDD